MAQNHHEQPPVSRNATVTLALAVGAVALLFSCQRIYDPDTWWHLATGRWVLANHAVPRRDVFSFATAGAPWVAHSWAADAVMAWLHGLGGPTALILVKGAIVATGFAAAHLLTARAGASPGFAAVALVAVVPMARYQFLERPQILMFPMVALFVGLLLPLDATRRRATWIVLALAALAWTNLHGSFLLGPLIAGALLFERMLWRMVPALTPPGITPDRALALAVGLFALVTGLGLANPWGVGLPVQMIRDITSFALTRSFAIEEHLPLVPGDHAGFVVLTALTAASFVAARRHARPFLAAVYVGFSVLAFRSVRFAAIAAMVDACVLSLNVRPLSDRLELLLGDRARPPQGRVRGVAVALLLAAIAGGSFLTEFRPGREARFGIGVNERRFPGPTVAFLARSGFEGNLFNSWVHGGYLLWYLPRVRTSVDGRTLPAQVGLLDRLAQMDSTQFDRWLTQSDVKGALLTRDDGALPFFQSSPRFVKAAFDDRAILFLRADLAAASASRYRFIRPDELDSSYIVPIARGPQAAEAEAEVRRAIADSPSSLSPRFLLGAFLEARGDAAAFDEFLTAVKLNPGLAFAHYDVGRRVGALGIANGRVAEAEPILRDALAVRKADPELESLLGTTLYLQKKLSEAEEVLRRALSRSPDQPLALTNLGYLLADTRRPDQAVPLFRRAVALAPRDENAAYGLALVLQASGDRAGAAAAWRSFLSGFPASPWAPRARQRLADCNVR